jgi:hypothetical protein
MNHDAFFLLALSFRHHSLTYAGDLSAGLPSGAISLFPMTLPLPVFLSGRTVLVRTKEPVCHLLGSQQDFCPQDKDMAGECSNQACFEHVFALHRA